MRQCLLKLTGSTKNHRITGGEKDIDVIFSFCHEIFICLRSLDSLKRYRLEDYSDLFLFQSRRSIVEETEPKLRFLVTKQGPGNKYKRRTSNTVIRLRIKIILKYYEEKV